MILVSIDLWSRYVLPEVAKFAAERRLLILRADDQREGFCLEYVLMSEIIKDWKWKIWNRPADEDFICLPIVLVWYDENQSVG